MDAPQPPVRPATERWKLLVLGAAVAAVLIAPITAVLLSFDRQPMVVNGVDAAAETLGGAEDSLLADIAPLEIDVEKLQASLNAQATPGLYLVVDRANNRLWVRSRDSVVLEAVVSTGSHTILRESTGRKRTWTFDTPSGRYPILSERRHPVWVKPDWAFLEEGQPPPERVIDRIENGSLGEWALDLGDGYMIHGTLYERLLGRSITHGCIRVGRDDLRAVARAAEPGTPVFIF